MKKVLLSIFVLLILIGVGIYGLLFTPMGNGIVASMIEDKANELKKANFKVEKFVLTTQDIDFIANVDNNSKISVQGKFALIAQNFDFTYDVNVQDLSKLKTLIGADLQGDFQTKGSVKGNKELIVVKGVSGVFDSKTSYDANLVDLELKNINFDVKNAKIDKLLYSVKQPNYAKGLLSINGKLKDLQGKINTTITKGLVNNPVVNKAFNQKLVAPLHFSAKAVTNLDQQKAVSKADVLTTMANVYVKEASVVLKDASIKSDYTVDIKDLSKLYDVAQMKLRGKVLLVGEVIKNKDLTVTGNSSLLDGTLNFKLHNDDLMASIQDIEVVKALYMLHYPEVFTSKSDLTLKYNLKSQQGKVNGQLLDGQFLPNEYSTVLKNVAKFDITKEVYKTVVLNSDLNKNVIKSTVDMKSKYTHIMVPKSVMDTKKRTIDALIKTTLKKTSFDTTVTGSLDKPKVKIDTTKLLKDEVKRKAKEKIEEKIKEKLGEGAGNLLKGLFSK